MEAVLAIATRLAAASPGASLPCPLCGASVRAANLEGHVEKVHGAVPIGNAAAAPITVTGVDRRVVPSLATPIALWTILVGVAAVAGFATDDRLAMVFVVGLGVSSAPLLLAMLGAFRARLTLDGDEVRLQYALGLREVRVRLPSALEVGALTTIRTVSSSSSVETNQPGEEVRVGVYLRLADALTLGAPKGTGLRSHWRPDAWRAGPARRRCDVMLDRKAMIAVEYHLAGRGHLTPR